MNTYIHTCEEEGEKDLNPRLMKTHDITHHWSGVNDVGVGFVCGISFPYYDDSCTIHKGDDTQRDRWITIVHKLRNKTK